MRRSLKALLSVVLCVCLLVPVGAGSIASSAQPAASALSLASDAPFGIFLARLVNAVSDFLINTLILGVFNAFLPTTSKVADYDSFDLDAYGNFYPGTDTFIDEARPGAQWSLGYAERSILPADFGTRPYVKGSLAPYSFTTKTLDDLRVRTVVLDDGSGRGKIVFCVIDAIGIANADVRKIRAAASDIAIQNNIVSINVSVSHTHNGIDSQGVWTDPAGTTINNLANALTGFTQVKSGVDATFLQTMIDRTTESIAAACGRLEPGSLYLAKKSISDYVRDRTYPNAMDDNLYRLRFVPDDSASRPTIIATFACHPETTSYSSKEISADFIYYMEEAVNRGGENFIFIQGNVGTVTSSRSNSDDGLALNNHEEAARFGYEMGYITLALTATARQCETLNKAWGDLLGVEQYAGTDGYSVWYKNWQPVTETAVTPILNIRMEQFILPVDNGIFKAMGKASIANNLILKEKGTGACYSVTELGYMEIGRDLKVLISPGEIMSEILVGGPGLDGFKYDSLRSMFGENLIIFDLMNDAIGYIAADPNYVMVGMQYNPDNGAYESDSWCLFSFGKNTGSTIVERFIQLEQSVR